MMACLIRLAQAVRNSALVWVLATLFAGVFPAPAAPFARVIPFVQPDGTAIQIWGQGDEFRAVFETLDGFTVVYDPALGGYCFARLSPDAKLLESTGKLVGQANGEAMGLPKHLRIDPATATQQAAIRRRKWEADLELPQRWSRRKAVARETAGIMAAALPPPASTTTGTKVGLTLLIDFDNDPATVPQAEIVNFLNGENYTGFGNNGSVKQYFRDNSNGQLIYSNVVTIYLRVPNSLHPKSWYADTTKDSGSQGNLLIRDALQILKALPNYTSQILPTFASLSTDPANRVVACNVFYAGGNGGVWNKGLWPHAWALYDVGAQELSPGGVRVWSYQITDIGGSLELGTFCHENGHLLCDYPDLYDYENDSEGGAGDFCLMNSGGNGVNPAQICAYLKYKSGWATTTELTSNSVLSASVKATAGTGFNHFYRFARPGVPTEYFLVENRQNSGRDATLPVGGVAVWHVDELGDRDNQSLAPNAAHANYEVSLVQADNQWDFQNNVNSGDTGDLYRAGNPASGYANKLSDTSAPSAHWWDGSPSGMSLATFSAAGATMTFEVLGTGNPAPVILQSPQAVSVVAGAGVEFAVVVSGQSPFSHQWLRNGTTLTNSARYSGATSNRLVIASVQSGDAGGYQVVVSNGFGTVTSAPAILTVYTSPIIVSQPRSLATNAGSPVSFAVTAQGVAPLSYQWRKDQATILGANGSSYTLSAVGLADAGSYSVVVSNVHGFAVSSNAILGVTPFLTIGEAVDSPLLAWGNGGVAPWTGQTVVTHDGVDAAASGLLSSNQQSSFSVSVVGPTNVSFWWKVSSEMNFDFLQFRINGTNRARISGEVDWTQRRINIPGGPQLLEWRYAKDNDGAEGVDRAWVDQIHFGDFVPTSFADAVESPELAWTSYGDSAWLLELDITRDGVDAAQSGAIADFGYTGTSLTVTGPGRLSFWWKVSSEVDYDFMELYLDDNLLPDDQISGEVGWTQRSITVGPGLHYFDFQYSKDVSDSAGEDAGWLDQVIWVADDEPPRILRQPVSQTVESGDSVVFSVEAVGAGEVTYHWRRNGAPISGASATNYSIPAAAGVDSGAYSVVVSNANGVVISGDAVLTVLSPVPLAEALDAPSLAWDGVASPGDKPWVGQLLMAHDGVDAARSGIIGDGGQSSLKTSVIGPGTIRFWWRVSSETNFDSLYFYLGESEKARISGEAGWQERTFSVPSGEQVPRWVYAKDLSVGNGQDRAWLDQVTYVPSNQPPVVSGIAYSNRTFSVAVPTLAGRSYTLEFKNSLAATNWLALPAVAGDGLILWLSDPTATNAQRFYRIRSP